MKASVEQVREYAEKAYSDLAGSGFAEFGSDTQVAIVDTAGDALASDGYDFDRDALVSESKRLA